MIFFWLSVVLAIFIGGCTLIGINNGLGLQLFGLIFAANAYVRLQQGKPVKTSFNFSATIIALLLSGVGLAIGLYRVMQ